MKVRRLMLSYVHKRRAADEPDDDKCFFLNKNRKPLKSEAVKTLMGRLKKRASIPRLHAHLFRHTYATNFLINQLGDIYELSRLLGHTETKTTEVYLSTASYYAIIANKRRKTYLDLKS
jgi:integrase/recombinase XerC/integrase/recombinase XerD